MSARDLDLICLGRAAVDLYGEQLGAALEQVQSFAKSLGGCAANIAVGAARQGLKVAMLSRVGDEQMGRFVLQALADEGVDITHVHSDPSRLTGLVLLSIRGKNDFPLLFYRENCADMALSPEDFDADFVGRARALLLTGTHFSTPGVEVASWSALRHAKARGTKVVLDVDFRPVLWGLTGHEHGADRFVASPRVTRVFDDVLGACDLVVGTEDEMRLVGGTPTLLEAMQRVRAKTGATLVLKRGARGCVVFDGEVRNWSSGIECPPTEVEVYNVLGAGDAFMAGFLRGWLEGASTERCGELGNGAGALVVGRHACAPAMPTRIELDHFLTHQPRARHAIEDDPQLVHVHRSTLRPPPPKALCVLAFDHRSHFSRLIGDQDGGSEALIRLKLLVAEGGLRGAERAKVEPLGMIIDAEGGQAALSAMTRRPGLWLARPIERPDYRPLAFEGGLENVDARLRTWPAAHVVKCLVQFHPDGDPSLQEGQTRRLRWLQEACNRLERALLVELLPMRSARPEPDVAAVPRALERLYDAGLYPEWWKLPPQPEAQTWAAIDEVVERRDPRCLGILVLGNEASAGELAEAFALARRSRYTRGFAVGRTIFGGPARDWVIGELDDEGLVEAVSHRFQSVVKAWRASGETS